MKYAKNTSLILISVIALAGCADKETVVREGSPTNGALSLNANAITVSPASADQCPTGGAVYTLFIDTNSNGLLDAGELFTNQQTICNGANGVTGSSGVNGLSLVFQPIAASAELCPSGGTTIVMAQDTNSSGLYDSADQNAKTMTICNGTNGTNGTDAALPAYAPVAPIYPCGNTVAYKEVLLRLSNGQILSSFSDNTAGAMTRLIFLPDGTYVDTDNSSCQFSVATSGSTRSISWGGQVQQSWAISY